MLVFNKISLWGDDGRGKDELIKVAYPKLVPKLFPEQWIKLTNFG